jgi:hypothetical protein
MGNLAPFWNWTQYIDVELRERNQSAKKKQIVPEGFEIVEN